jgi:hypothetical protein
MKIAGARAGPLDRAGRGTNAEVIDISPDEARARPTAAGRQPLFVIDETSWGPNLPTAKRPTVGNRAGPIQS